MIWIETPNGAELLTYKDVFCHTVFSNMDYQIFYSEKGNFVYDKRKEEIVEMVIDAWTRMVLKLESLLNDPPKPVLK